MDEIKQGDCLRLTSFEYVSERGTRLRFKMPRKGTDIMGCVPTTPPPPRLQALFPSVVFEAEVPDGLDWEQFQDHMTNVSHDDLALHIGRQIIISIEEKMSVPRFPEMVVGVENRTIDDPWSASNEQ